MSKKGILRDLLEVLPDPPGPQSWQRFITAFDFIGRYLYGLPDQPERSDEAWEGLLAEAHDEMAEAVALLGEERVALAATVAEMRAVSVVSEPAPIMPISFPEPAAIAGRWMREARAAGDAQAAADAPDAAEAPNEPVEAPAADVAAPVAAPAPVEADAELSAEPPPAIAASRTTCQWCGREFVGPRAPQGRAGHERVCSQRPGATVPTPKASTGKAGQAPARIDDLRDEERAAIREVAQRSLTTGADESRAAAAEFAAKRNAAAKRKADETWAERHPGEVRA